MQSQSQVISGVVTFVILALIVRRTLTTQTVRVWTLLAVPMLMIVAAAAVVMKSPLGVAGSGTATPSVALTTGVIVIGAIAGAGLGYARGIHSKVGLGPRPGTLVVQGNVALAVILIAAFAVRFALRTFAGSSGVELLFSDGFIVFAAASVAVARAMLFFAWRRLLATGATSLA